MNGRRFDQRGHGHARTQLQFRGTLWREQGGEWKPVVVRGGYPVARDQWCAVSFEPVATTSLRLVVKLQKDYAGGVHEWKVIEADDE